MRGQHIDFARTINDELLCRRTTDALAAYLQLYPEGVLVNMEELEGLITTLSVEVGQQWEVQIQLWNDAIAQAQVRNRELATAQAVLQSAQAGKGKAVEPVGIAAEGASSGEGNISLGQDLATVCRERDDARQQLQEVRS